MGHFLDLSVVSMLCMMGAYFWTCLIEPGHTFPVNVGLCSSVTL